MVDTADARPLVQPPLPSPTTPSCPPVWGRITNLDVDRGEGSWLITRDGERYLDYTSGIGVTNTGHAHPAGRGGDRRRRRPSSSTASRTSCTTSRGCGCTSGCARLLPGGPWQAFLSNSGAEAVEAAVKLARVATGRPAILAFRYGYHGRTAQTMALTTAKDVYRGGVRAAAGLRLPHGLPVLLPGRRRPARPGRLHLRLGGPARPDLPPARLPGAGRRDHRRAGPRRGRLHRAAARLPAAAARDHPPARDPAHRRRGPDRLRADRRAVRGRPLGRRARHPRHGQGHRLGAAAVGDPRAARS